MPYVRIDPRGRITLPRPVRRALGLPAAGDATLVLARTRRGTYELFPAASVPHDRLWLCEEEIDSAGD
jgi:bifunctional DNA-binding transcriptional regulator/antitoxin component of YhaV-PrlF toxin-antitoxin module